MAGWGRELLGKLSGDLLILLGYLPYLLAVINIVLAEQFNRSRYMLLALLTAGSFWLIQTHLQVSLSDPNATRIYLALSITMPLSVLFLMLVPERGIWNRFGLVYALATGVLVLAAPRILELVTILVGERVELLAIWPRDNWVLPLVATGAFALTLLVGLLMLLWRGDETEVALVATLSAGLMVLAGFHLNYVSLALFNVAGVVQVLSILRSSHAMAYRDDLTGLLGRRALNERLKGLGPRYSIAMMDVDHFKKFNDTYGHDVGDEVLKMVAGRIARVGAGGTPFRYGGEEFCVLFPRKSAEECIDALEDIRESIADYRMTLRDRGQRPTRAKEGQRKRGGMATKIKTGTVAVTISVGLAESSGGAYLPEEVIKEADKQLYRAKQKGRNRLCSEA
jgi:diguanylate cyclase (GGDEF)-like protein